jgi:hypothetical protein
MNEPCVCTLSVFFLVIHTALLTVLIAAKIVKEHGLTQDPSGMFILKTPLYMEAMSLWSHNEQFLAMERLRELSPVIPIHVIIASRCNVM